MQKIYQLIPDNRAAKHQFIRVIDESGEDYLYPVAYFVPIELPKSVEAVFIKFFPKQKAPLFLGALFVISD